MRRRGNIAITLESLINVSIRLFFTLFQTDKLIFCKLLHDIDVKTALMGVKNLNDIIYKRICLEKINVLIRLLGTREYFSCSMLFSTT